MLLLDEIDADADGASFPIQRVQRGAGDSVWSVYVWATNFGGGTVTIQVSPDNGVNWFTVRDIIDNQALFTVSDMRNIYLRGTHVRAKLSGAVGASNVSAKLM